MSDTAERPLTFSIDRSLLKGIGIALAAGVVLAFSQAFGMTSGTLGQRFAYWLPLMFVGAIWGHVCSRGVERWIDLDQRPWLGALALTTLMSGPLSIVVWAWTGWLYDRNLHREPGHILDFLLPVTVVTGVLSLLNVFLQRKPVQTHAALVGAPAARFPDRLPLKLKGAAIRAVESEDHYLRVHTDRGSDLILMRLSDALTELEGLEGAQTHRSWWVARDAVRGVDRGDGRATLTLDGGLQVPVSRRYARALREAGWY
ncbi:LytTR family DNA-binding domain-containing protein [Brevundimonas sp. NPDC092305]|uniref:LytTR family DNA-binding domain-containing protein n=1 Tax=Brevundimonas sp. NPDC092305 TaxID=3363957 RepID=UPI0037F89699